MLTALSIQNIVLIDRLNLEFAQGLSVLTGETGAGKSILLDALCLALGGRGDVRLVRKGQAEGQVTAAFALQISHPVFALLSEHGLCEEDGAVLRRVQLADGRTKAFINERPVSVQLLRKVGAMLVEIHGQHDDRALLDSQSHRLLVDAYGGLEEDRSAVTLAWHNRRDALQAVEAHERQLARVREEVDFLRLAVEELAALNPKDNEEVLLADHRQAMMAAEKTVGDLEDAYDVLAGGKGASDRLNGVLRRLGRQEEAGLAITGPAVQALERLLIEIDDVSGVLAKTLRKAAFEPSELENTEERLFALRAASRKFKVPVAVLAGKRQEFERQLAAIDHGEKDLIILREAAVAAGEAYRSVASLLSDKRKKAAKRLDRAVTSELGPLKFEKAEFLTRIETVAFEQGGEEGIDRVAFWVKTNPGTEPGPIMKVASGGELSRFILALKVVLAERGAAPVLIFDEIDSGVGGATASAIGERLARLASGLQVLTITHAPQIAALADCHLNIAKEAQDSEDGESVVTRVAVLEAPDRREEIARMLAGALVTDEARKAAERLIGGSR